MGDINRVKRSRDLVSATGNERESKSTLRGELEKLHSGITRRDVNGRCRTAWEKTGKWQDVLGRTMEKRAYKNLWERGGHGPSGKCPQRNMG